MILSALPNVHRNSALLLDVDGTLLDFASTPTGVVVPDDLARALAILRDELGGALAFVSGRALDAIDTLFGPLHAAAVGSHGAEIRDADGGVTTAPVMAEPVRVLFQRLARSAPGLLLEDKKYVLSLHYRQAPQMEPVLRAAIAAEAALFRRLHVSILHGKYVLDARPEGIDKGTGVRTLLRHAPFAGRAVLFGGDDTTDLDVFRILPELGGAGFSVGREFENAGVMFASPHEVRRWLTGLAETGIAS